MGPHGRRLLVSGFASLLVLPLLQTAVSAAVSCSFDLQAKRVTLNVSGTAVIQRGASTSSDADPILFGAIVPDRRCTEVATSATDATVTNTNRIVINGSSGADSVVVSLAGGAFAPGADVADESPAFPELEITVNLQGGSDRLEIAGSAEPDRITFGNGALPFRHVSLNRDDDADITFLRVENPEATGAGGADFISGQGGFGSGSPISLSLILEGGGGINVIEGGLVGDALFGGPEIDALDGDDGDDVIESGLGIDTLRGGAGEDELINPGGAGDQFLPEGDDDVLTGSPDGRDTINYGTSPGPVSVLLAQNRATGDGTDLFSSIENAIGTPFDDTLSGDAGRNVLSGREGGDILQGAQEADVLVPGPGIDSVAGGQGLDVVGYLEARDPVVVDLGAGTATGEGNDTLVAVENVAGSAFGDQLTGSAGPNVMFGFDGADTLDGLGGDDRLLGGNDPDDVDGGPGRDQCESEVAPGSVVGCEEILSFIGTHDLKPRNATVEPGERITYRLAWTHPRRWRRLDTVELRVRDGDRVLTWVRWNQEGNTFQLFDPRAGGFSRRHEAGSDAVLTSTFARLHLPGSDADALGPRTILVAMRLSFRRAAIGEHVVEVTAEDHRGRRDAWQRAGSLRVLR